MLKQILKDSAPVQICLTSLLCSKCFVYDCLCKQIFIYNQSQPPSNFNNSAKFLFTTNIQHSKHSIRAVSRLKTPEIMKQEKTGNIKIGWRQSIVPSLPSRKKTVVTTIEITQNQLSKFSVPLQLCSISLLCSKYFVHDCQHILISPMNFTQKFKGKQSF